MRKRRLVYVSGAPGAGKTSLAGPLAALVDVAAGAASVRAYYAAG